VRSGDRAISKSAHKLEVSPACIGPQSYLKEHIVSGCDTQCTRHIAEYARHARGLGWATECRYGRRFRGRSYGGTGLPSDRAPLNNRAADPSGTCDKRGLLPQVDLLERYFRAQRPGRLTEHPPEPSTAKRPTAPNSAPPSRANHPLMFAGPV